MTTEAGQKLATDNISQTDKNRFIIMQTTYWDTQAVVIFCLNVFCLLEKAWTDDTGQKSHYPSGNHHASHF